MGFFGDIKKGRIPGGKKIPGIGGKGPRIPKPGDVTDIPKLVSNEVSKAVPTEVQKAVGELTGDIQELLVQALLAMASEGTKPGLALAGQMARLADRTLAPVYRANPEDAAALDKVPFVLPFTVGVVSLGFYWYGVFGGQRLKTIAGHCENYSRKGIGNSRSDIIRTCKDFGPDLMDFGVGVNVSLGIQFGVTPSIWSLPTKYFLLLADEAMKQAGVPK